MPKNVVDVFRGDGNSDAVVVGENGVHISIQFVSGTGTVKPYQKINGTWYEIFEDGTAISDTGSDDYELRLKPGDMVRLTASATTTPVIEYAIRG